MIFQGPFADVMMITAEDRDPAPISQEASEKVVLMLRIEAEQRNWSWLLNPQQSAKLPSLDEGSSSDSEEEPVLATGETSAAPAATDAPQSPVAYQVDEDSEDDGDDYIPIGS